jgi:hypothetical protein
LLLPPLHLKAEISDIILKWILQWREQEAQNFFSLSLSFCKKMKINCQKIKLDAARQVLRRLVSSSLGGRVTG